MDITAGAPVMLEPGGFGINIFVRKDVGVCRKHEHPVKIEGSRGSVYAAVCEELRMGRYYNAHLSAVVQHLNRVSGPPEFQTSIFRRPSFNVK